MVKHNRKMRDKNFCNRVLELRYGTTNPNFGQNTQISRANVALMMGSVS